jgi:hypothetical protein
MHKRVRSERWGTVSLSAPVYKRLAQPFMHFIQQAEPAVEDLYCDLAADNTPY